MTRTEWIAAFVVRYVGLSGMPLTAATKMAETKLDGAGTPGRSLNLGRDPVEMADELDEAETRDGGGRINT